MQIYLLWHINFLIYLYAFCWLQLLTGPSLTVPKIGSHSKQIIMTGKKNGYKGAAIQSLKFSERLKKKMKRKDRKLIKQHINGISGDKVQRQENILMRKVQINKY